MRRSLTTEQIKALKPDQVSLLIEDQREALIINILAKSYNKSDKSLEGFKKELGAYDVLRAIKDQDTQKAFSAIYFVAKGQELTAENIQTLESSRTWFEFIEQLVTYLFNCFRTEKQQQESIGEAKGNFQSFVKQQQNLVSSARAA